MLTLTEKSHLRWDYSETDDLVSHTGKKKLLSPRRHGVTEKILYLIFFSVSLCLRGEVL
jgi:hypothetical protein